MLDVMTKEEIKFRPDRLTYMMQKRGLKASQLEYMTGISGSMLSLMLSGQRDNPGGALLARLAARLGCTVDYLMGMTDNPNSVNKLEEELNAATGQSEIDQLIRNLSPAKKEQVLEFAKYLLSVEQSNHVESNRRAFTAVLNVIDRRLGARATGDVIAALRREFPDLDALVGTASDCEHDAMRVG